MYENHRVHIEPYKVQGIVVAGLIPDATISNKGLISLKGTVNFSFYNAESHTKYYQVLTYPTMSNRTISLLCNMKSVLDTERLFLICARIHSNDNYVLKVQKHPIVGTVPKLYIDNSNKKVYVEVTSFISISFLVLCGGAECFTFNDKITIDSVEGLEML